MSSIWMAEIGIVGAGPAGARAAEHLATLGADVILIDRRAPWEKPCGGGLPAAAFDEIPELEELKDFARPIRAVRLETEHRGGFEIPLDRPLWIVPRISMSRWQLDRAISAGARHLRAGVTAVRRLYGGWRLDTDARAVIVRRLVGADGAASLVRRVAAPKLRIELAPTRVAFPHRVGPAPEVALLRFYSGVAGYLWDFPRPDHRSVGIGVSNGTWKRPRMDSELEEYRSSSVDCACEESTPTGAVIGTAQLGHGDFAGIAGPHYALLGDAAGLADPLTGEGIRNALRSAELLATAWLGSGDFRSYPELAQRAFSREFHIARLLRRSFLESDTGTRLLARSLESNLFYSTVSALVNAINEQDTRLVGLLRRTVTGFWATRRNPEKAHKGTRLPAPCDCSPGRRGGSAGVCCSVTAQA